MKNPRTRTRRLTLAGLAAASLTAGLAVGPVTPAHAADTLNWKIDANTIHSVDQQERNLTGGDEVYVASITFRSTPGKVGSTSTSVVGDLGKINDFHTGDTRTISDSKGKVTFNNVTRRGLTDILAGNNPEIIGTITFAFEDDFTTDNAVRNLLDDVAAETKTQLAAVIEPLTLADLLDSEALGNKLTDAVEAITDEVTPGLFGKIKLFLGSLGDPDDLISQKVNVFVAVDDSLSAIVDQKIGSVVSPSTGVAGSLRPRGYTQRFSGDGAIYDVTYAVAPN